MLVVRFGGRGVWVMKRIVKQEVDYLRCRKLPGLNQGRDAEVTSWLSDEGAKLTMPE